MRCSAQRRQREINREQEAEDQRQKERDVRPCFAHLCRLCVLLATLTVYVVSSWRDSTVCGMLSRRRIAAVQELKRKLWGGK